MSIRRSFVANQGYPTFREPFQAKFAECTLHALDSIVLWKVRRAYERVRSNSPHISERKDSPILMSEQRSFWQRLFGRAGGSSLSPRQQKVSDYIIARMEKEVPFRQVLKEDYVRRNGSQAG